MEVVLVDTVRRGRLADMAGAAREHQLVIDAVLLGVEQIGAFTAELEVNLIRWLGVATSRGRRASRHAAMMGCKIRDGRGIDIGDVE